MTCISHANITCLRISDFNTQGVSGSREQDPSPWRDLTINQGSCDKPEDAAGSFGVGKFAPFACSALQTIFYSTVTSSDCAYQGVSRTASYSYIEAGANYVTQGVGFFGNDKNMPMFEQHSLDPAFKRAENETGTDVFVLGFDCSENWEKRLAAAVVDRFLCAIYCGNLIADVNGLEVSKNTLPHLMDSLSEHLDGKTPQYYQVLTNTNEARKFEDELPKIPDSAVELHLLLKPNFSKRVAMVRSAGMKILDRQGFGGTIPFAGVLFIKGLGLNKLLRSAETPTHTAWEEARANDPRKFRDANKAIFCYIRDRLKDMKDEAGEELVDAPVGKYLPETVGDEKSARRRESISDEIKKIEKHIYNPRKDDSGNGNSNRNTGDRGRNGNVGRSGNKGEGGNDRGSVDKDEEKYNHIPLTNTRCVVTNRENGDYLVLFTPKESDENGVLEVFVSAEEDSYPAKILDAHDKERTYTVRGNRILGISFKNESRMNMSVRIGSDDLCALEIKAKTHEIKK